jgi:hypothetical protein
MRKAPFKIGLILLCICTLLCACNQKAPQEDTSPATTQPPEEHPTETQTEQEESSTQGDPEMSINTAPIYPIAYQGIEPTFTLTRFIEEVDNKDGSHNNEAHDVGAIVSPYFTILINGQEVPCYSVRTSRGAHSFAMLDATEQSFPLSVQISTKINADQFQVMPLHYGVIAKTEGKEITTEIPAVGNYTLVPDDDYTRALTIFVRDKQEYTAPEGYEVIRIAPGKHDTPITFTAEKQVIYFEAGIHEMRYALMFKSNTEVYFEPGAHIIATMPDASVEKPTKNPDWAGMTGWCALFQGQLVNNVRICGRAFIDLTRLDWHARSVIQFDQCENVTVEGITMNNSPEWTMFFTQSKNITVNEVMLFGYRQNSDGIAVVDSANAVIKNCFARSGDDLFEVKSMYGACQIKIENIVFENNNAWPDKCRGMGIIYESQRDMSDIHFIGGSVAFAPADWMDDLGALIIFLNDRATLTDISFQGIEVYSSVKYPINVSMNENASAKIKDVIFKDITVYCDTELKIENRSKNGKIESVRFIDCVRGGAVVNDKAGLNLRIEGVDESVVSYGE